MIIFHASLSCSTLPKDWKTARVVLIFKKGDRLRLENYRPISLTSSCCKLIEHVIAKALNEFLVDKIILTSFQHGFRKGYSTVTQLVTVIHTFASAIDNNNQIDLIFLDFSKAFDKVTHSKLIFKLRKYDIPEILVSWIAEYLRNREQFVDIGGHHSACLPVTSGVPQVSVLGPLLFLLYVNDIVDVVKPNVQIRLYADDCVLFKEVTRDSDQYDLNDSLARIFLWCTHWEMTLNVERSVFLPISRKKTTLYYNYMLGSSPLKEVTNYKYLGVTICNNLSWNLHVQNISSSAFRKLYFLKYKLKHAPASVKLLAYYYLIRPKLEYACIAWDPYTQCNVKNLNVSKDRLSGLFTIGFLLSTHQLN